MKSQTLIDNGYFQGLDNLKKTEITSGRYKGRISESSLSISSGNDIALSLFNAFELGNGSDLETFRRGYNMAVAGDGDEESKILTIHSSSLLALLCFFSVSSAHPLTVGEDKYTEVLFEVKNVVIRADERNPSNVDVVLVSKTEDGRARKLLFLESKFTEYITHGHAELAPKYHEYYNILKDSLPDLKFSIANYDVLHKNGSVSTVFGLTSDERQYLGGIKQAFSHLLGIATKPAKDENIHREAYAEYYKQADVVEFATIAHDWNQFEFRRYSDLYSDTFKNENLSKIREGLKKIAPNHNVIDRLQIRPNILTYKEVFKGFYLPGIIRKVYKL